MREVLLRGVSSDFWKFWTGQTISTLGSSVTSFALPLLVFKLTGSSLNLALTIAANVLPYLLFGLVVGAWVDRVNRKRLMIVTDLARALVIASIPLLAALRLLSVWWIYVVAFSSSTLSIGFVSAQFAAIPSLVKRDDLVTANGRIQAGYSTAAIFGPLLGGLLLALIPLPSLLLLDAFSFLVSAGSLGLIRRSFNLSAEEKKTSTSLRQDLLEGLRYVLGHPVLGSITLMMALVNFVAVTANAQLVLFAKQWLAASDTQVGLLYSAGSIGVIVFSLTAGYVRKRWPYSKVMLAALMLEGLTTAALILTHQYWAALLIWSLHSGVSILFDITGLSLLQTSIPNHLLGRVRSVLRVVAWSAAPLGALLGSFAIDRTKNVGLVYGVIGMLVFFIALAFSFTPLGRAEHYLALEE